MRKHWNLLIAAIIGVVVGTSSTLLLQRVSKMDQPVPIAAAKILIEPTALIRAVALMKADIEVGLLQNEFDHDLKTLKVEYALVAADLEADKNKATRLLIYRADALSQAWHNDISPACAYLNNGGRLATGKSYLKWSPPAKKYQAPCIASVSSFLYATGIPTPVVESALSDKNVEDGLILKTFISLGLNGVHSSASELYQSFSSKRLPLDAKD